MNENSYLNPADIKNQCDAAIRNLEQNNQATQLTGWNLDLFIGDSQLESEAFAALKQQMEDYKTVLQTIRMANQCDIEDFQFLKMVVGNQELDGNVILEQKDIAMSAKKSDEEKVEKYRKKANSTNSATLRLNYSMKVAHYRVMAEIDQRLYDAWQEKQNMYDGIEGLTAGLFERSAAMRATVENALTSIRGAFQNGVYVPDMNASWRSEVYDIYFNSVFTISDNGEFKIDMEEVEKILSKDARDITAAEYDVLAMAYLMADDEDLAVFIQCMMKDRKDYHFEILWDEERDSSEWSVDHEKLEQMINRIEKASLEKLSLLQEIRASGDAIKVLEYEEQRDALLQRLTLLNVINQCVSFDGEYQADCPKFTIENKEGDLVVGFLEKKTPDEFSQISRLLESTITIHNTENGTDITEKMIDNVRYLFDCRFSQYALEDYITDKAEGRIMKNVVDSIPGKGIVAGIGMDLWMGQQQAQKNHKFIEEQFDALSAGYVYSSYDCSANFVDYDMEYENEHKIFIYEGKETREKINALNSIQYDNEGIPIPISIQLVELLKEEFPPDGLTMEIILTRPEEVYKFKKGLTGDMESLYRNIVDYGIEKDE